MPSANHLKSAFCRVIDNYETSAQSLIEDCSVKEGDPVIAISVDMLDTGIDVPEIVNLVFFKLYTEKKFSVRSHIQQIFKGLWLQFVGIAV